MHSEPGNDGRMKLDGDSELKQLFERSTPHFASVDVAAVLNEAAIPSEAAVPNGPLPHLVEATCERLPLPEAPPCRGLQLRSRRTLMFRIARTCGMTAVLALLVVSAWSLVTDRSASLAFAEVQEQVKKVRSVRYIETRTNPQPDGRAAVVEEKRHFVLGRYLKRTEDLDQDAQADRISISDAEHGKYVVIHPRVKRFVILATQVQMDLDGGNRMESEITANPEADFYKVVREIPAEAKPLPEKTIDDQRVLGFVFEEQSGGYTWKRTYWVDLETKLPVRIEVSAFSTDQRLRPSNWVKTGFVFDEELDESLFSTSPPPDSEYKVETQSIMGIRPPK